MKTHFYERTAYKLSEQPVPPCFLKLDDHFDANLTITRGHYTHIGVLLAESICSRMADIEMYAFLIEDARKRYGLERDGDAKAVVLTRSFLIGYLGACRSLLEVGAVALVTLYRLPVNMDERSFINANFWQQLVTIAPNVHRRYHPLRLFFHELFRWSNESAARVPPLLVSYTQFGQFSSREMHLKVVDETNPDLAEMTAEMLRLNWIDPLLLHDRWKPKFLSLCERLCLEIEECI